MHQGRNIGQRIAVHGDDIGGITRANPANDAVQLQMVGRRHGGEGAGAPSSFGAALGGVVAASRILLAMGRDDVLPRRIFGRVAPESDAPRTNILLVSAIALAGALLMNLERAGELLNFGALLGFMGVNLAAFRQCYLRQEASKRHLLMDAVAPLLGK